MLLKHKCLLSTIFFYLCECVAHENCLEVVKRKYYLFTLQFRLQDICRGQSTLIFTYNLMMEKGFYYFYMFSYLQVCL